MSKKNDNQPMDPEKEQNQPVEDETADVTEKIEDAAEDTADEISEEAKVNLRKALQEVQEENDRNESEQADEGKKAKKPKRERTPKEEAERALNRVKRRKKLKYGSLATVITLVVIAIVVVVNIICSVVEDRFGWSVDLTTNGLYEIDEKTVDYLHQITNDIQITVLADESYFLDNNLLKVESEVLNRFKTESGNRISVDYVDITKNPEAVRQYSENYSGEFQFGDVIVANGDLVRVIPSNDMIRQDQSVDYTTYQYVTNYTFVGEQSLVSALMGVTDLNPVKVAVIEKMNGENIYYQYDQYCYTVMNELLTKNNYETTSLDITTDELSADYDLAILCAPYNDLSDAQIEKLNNYMFNGGVYGKKLVYFASPNQQSTPKLDEFLATWGISVGDAIVYEGNEAAAQYIQIALGQLNSVPVAATTDNELNANNVASKLPIVTPLLRPLELLFEQNAGRTTDALLVTPETTYLFPMDAKAETFDKSSAESGSFVAAARADTIFTEGSETYTGTMVAFGSAWFLDYYIANTPSYQNADYFVSVLNTLTGKESVLTIAEKSLDNTTISITEAQVQGIRTVTLFVIPLAVALVGIIVYVRRRNK